RFPATFGAAEVCFGAGRSVISTGVIRWGGEACPAKKDSGSGAGTWSDRSAFHLGFRMGAPFSPGSVIDGDIGCAGAFQGERQGDGGDARAAGGDDGAVERHAALGK